MFINNDLTASFARECFSYDPELGILTWLHRPIEHFNNESRHKVFIKRFAGKLAGWVSSDGYSNVRINGKAYRYHRIVWLVHFGKWPDNYIDHINGDISDNRISNLRDVDKYENAHNMRRPSNNSTGMIGVSLAQKGGGYRAQIMAKGQRIYLGRHASLEEAAEARKAAESRYDFHENHGR